MHRNDAFLSSGLTTNATRSRIIEKRKQRDEKDFNRAVLRPEVELIRIEIASLRSEIAKELINLIHVEMKPEDVKSAVIGLKLADSKLVKFELHLMKIMRVHDEKEKVK